LNRILDNKMGSYKQPQAARTKNDTVEERPAVHRPTDRQGRVSYPVGNDGVDFQAEASVTSYTAGVRITRSRGLNLPPTDPGD
jgi:hypothetical protein